MERLLYECCGFCIYTGVWVVAVSHPMVWYLIFAIVGIDTFVQ